MDGQESEGIVISPDELQDAKIDETLEMQRASMAGVIQPSGPEKKPVRRLIFTNWFYLMLAGGLAAFLAWAIIEPFLSDGLEFTGKVVSVNPDATESFIRTPSGVELRGQITLAGETVWRVTPGTAIVRRGNSSQTLQLEELKPGDVVRVDVEPVLGGSLLIADWIRVEPAGTPTVEQVNLKELSDRQALFSFLLFPIVAGLVGLMVGAVEGIICRTFARAAWCGGIGLLIGLVGGAIAIFPANIVYGLIGQLFHGTDLHRTAAGFLMQLFRRALGWTLVGMGMGLGQGIALRSRKLVLNGFIGGMVGGLVGGLLFDPIGLLLDKPGQTLGGEISRAVAITIIGAVVGIMIGLTDLLTRDAWLKVVAGPLRGKEFSFSRTPIRLGSSPKCDIYLFKDASIDPSHAVINKLRDTYEIADEGSASGVFINGQRIVKSHRLIDGDLVQIGESQFKYSTKESKKA